MIIEKTTITKNEYLQLTGLTVLVKRLNRTLDDLRRAACEIVGADPEEFGQIGDWAYNPEADVDDLLRKLKIEVEGKDG